uniref:Scaffoldin C n=1 Tax=Ruminococcus flavefaciens TaxID=1265 RepID=G9FER5_RUMFL|nr:scaffoldin C [Ruminococcus flavefaciens]
MKTKKVIVGAMAAMLSLSVCSLAPVVAAGETVQISVSKVNAEAGKQFSVDVSLADIPSSGIQALDFAVAYDSSVLTIDSVEAGAPVTKGASSADLTSSLLPLFEGSINSKEGYVSLMWSTAADSSYWLNGSGVFCTISGTVSSSAKQGAVSELKIVPIDRPTYSDSDSTNAEIGCGYESNGKPVKVATKLVNGSVTVGSSELTAKLRGDANCDSQVDMSDIVLIMQSLANPNKYGLNGTADTHLTEQGIANGDVDASVKGITGGDALKIQKWLLKLISEL